LKKEEFEIDRKNRRSGAWDKGANHPFIQVVLIQ
jgi:hypothetical protein